MTVISNNDIARSIYLAAKDSREPDILKQVVKFLNRKHLLSKSVDILLKLNKIINTEDGLLEVKVSSAEILSEKIKTELAQFLKKRYKAEKIIFIDEIDKSLLGGMKVQVNDEVIDMTIKNKIVKLQEHLTRKI